MKIKKGDTVFVIAGKDKGKEGKVTHVFRDTGKVIVEGLNQKKKHQRRRSATQKGQIVTVSLPVPASNVMLKDPKSGKPTRVGYSKEGKKKVRVAKKSGATV